MLDLDDISIFIRVGFFIAAFNAIFGYQFFVRGGLSLFKKIFFIGGRELFDSKEESTSPSEVINDTEVLKELSKAFLRYGAKNIFEHSKIKKNYLSAFFKNLIINTDLEEIMGDILELKHSLAKKGHSQCYIFCQVGIQLTSILFALILISVREKFFSLFKRQVDE